ncbi:hypothetical protein B5S27_g5796 [[Candida] boidinii]|nr:hypothetical protein B5S27_g5796 [[Candida] boidinii]
MNTERYFLTIVDDFTRWTYAVPIHNKSDVAQILQDFITASETHFSSRGYKVVAIRTDNGGEFCCDAVDSFLLSKGIAHQHTVPYNSHQNGVVERKHRTLEEKVRTLLASSGLSDLFWADALSTAEFIINRLPSPGSKVSPFELWNGYAPPLNIFRPFGCKVYAYIPPEKRPSKFSAATMECIFVGYSAIHKAYKVYHPSTHQIYISNQCKFDEAIFPAKVSSVASGISDASGSGISGASGSGISGASGSGIFGSGSGIFGSGSGISEESSVPAGSSYFGPTTAAPIGLSG